MIKTENTFHVVSKICNNIEDNILFQNQIKELIIEFSSAQKININVLDRVIMVSDLEPELNYIRHFRETKEKIYFTNTEYAKAKAKIVYIDLKKNPKAILYLTSDLLLSLNENRSTFLHILHHELSHLHDFDNLYINLKGHINPIIDDVDRRFINMSKAIWSEFFANYNSSNTVDNDSSSSTEGNFFYALENINQNIFAKKLEYQMRKIDLNTFLREFEVHADHLIISASYLLGYVIGKGYSLNDLLEGQSTLIDTVMEKTFYKMESCLHHMLNKYPYEWHDLNIFDEMTQIIIDYYNNIGISFNSDDGKEYMNVYSSKFDIQ